MKTALQLCVVFALIFIVLGRPIPASESLAHSQDSSQILNTSCLTDTHGKGICGDKHTSADKPTVGAITGRHTTKDLANSGGHSLGAIGAASLSVTSNTEGGNHHNKRNKAGVSKGDNEDEDEEDEDEDDGCDGDGDDDEDEDEDGDGDDDVDVDVDLDEDEEDEDEDEEDETSCDDEDN